MRLKIKTDCVPQELQVTWNPNRASAPLMLDEFPQEGQRSGTISVPI
jgi:hypothetical protein